MMHAMFLGHDPLLLAASLESLARDIRLLVDGQRPSLDQAPNIEAWQLVGRRVAVLDGIVQNHPIIADGHRALTSEIYALDPAGGWARTLSRFYVLGSRADQEG